MNKELAARTLMNILDVTHYYDYTLFTQDHLYDALMTYFQEKTSGQALSAGKELCMQQRKRIDQLEQGTLTQKDSIILFEAFRRYRRIYLLNKPF